MNRALMECWYQFNAVFSSRKPAHGKWMIGTRYGLIPPITAAGVDYISSGALIHSAQTVDFGLDF
ncbi:hypothetical protein N9O61_03235 [Octadecabacter sp.]|nr:hypothetical protein [Octadecabacter sp.]